MLRLLRRLLVWLVLTPVLLVMVFTGFPPPLPPGARRKPPTVVSQPWRVQQRQIKPGTRAPPGR